MCCKHMQIYVTIQCAELWNQKFAEMCNKYAQTFIFDYKNMQYQAIIGWNLQINNYAQIWHFKKKYAANIQQICSSSLSMSPFKNTCLKYAWICKICKHEIYMQNMQKRALSTLLMLPGQGRWRVCHGEDSVTVTGPRAGHRQCQALWAILQDSWSLKIWASEFTFGFGLSPV